MYIQEIHIESFRHLQNVHLGPFASPSNSSDLVVLAGPNGGGKSSILELLGYALSNSWSLGWQLSRSFPTNSFEVALAVTPEERDLIREHIEPRLHGAYPEAVRTYFDNRSTYYRSYNYSGGKYQEHASLYNEIHNLVSGALRNQYGRALGFFLKADRFYPSGNFDRRRLFEYSQQMERDYIWSMAFNTSDIQYRDMFDFLVQQRYHYFRRLGEYHHHINSRGAASFEMPKDPLLPYDELLQRLFPGYKFAEAEEAIPSTLFVQIPSGEIVPFHDLSSGEKEVFFILSFFLRHDVTDAVVVIDEPELHLHPELARLLIRTMQSIKPGNQVWLATHNTEIIDEAGRDRVVYVTRDRLTAKARVTRGTEEDEVLRTIKDMFGYSGYIGIAKRMVFLEGEDTSSDRKVFSNTFPDYGSSVKFIPAKSSDNQTRINAAILSILESSLGWTQFYLLRDRDYLTPEFVAKYNSHSSGRVYVLKRHEIENYLLNEELIARIECEIFNKQVTAIQVKNKLKQIARRISGEVLREMISFRLNLVYRPEDFSMGKILSNQTIVDDDGVLIVGTMDALKSSLIRKASQINSTLQSIINETSLDNLVAACTEEIRSALMGSDDEWKNLFPGKRILEEYAKDEGLGEPIVLQNSIIKEMSSSPDLVPEELRLVMQKVVAGDKLMP